MYTKEDEQYLRDNYDKYTNKELAKHLGRTSSAIEGKLSRMGLKKGNRGSWSKEDTDYLIENYSKFTNKELSIRLGRTENSVLIKGGRLGLSKDIKHITRKNRIKRLSKYEYLCKVCENYGSDSLHGLSIHLSKIHKDIDHSEYYLNNIGEMIKCYFCNEDGKFINLIDGYRDLCDSEICISKSRNSQSVDYLIRQGYSKDESMEILNQLNNERSVNGKLTIEERLENNPDFTKEKSPNCKEFYLKRGHSMEDAIRISSDVVLNMQEESHRRRTNNPEDYLHTYNNRVEYYLNQGYSEEESYQMLIDRQTTFSKEICIEKYGEEEGIRVWLDRQERWLKTLDDKTDEEKREINRKKLFADTGYSKISIEMFDGVYNELSEEMKTKTYYATNGGEFVRLDTDNDRHYKLDFVNSLNKKVIEFNGDFWHCNPNKYEGDYYHKIWKKTASEIWEDDKIRDEFITNSMGYELLVIWEDDYKQNKEKVIQECIEFLNN